VTEDRDGSSGRDDLGELWSWGAEASRAMSERVVTLYRDLGSSAMRAGSGDLDDELAKVRLDIERLVDQSLDVFDRFFAVVSRVVDSRGSGGTTPGELLVLRAAPGQTTSADVWVHNTSNEEHAAPRLHLPGLVTVDGACIAPSGIRISVSPAPIDGGNSRRVTLVIDVPPDARRGSYYGALIADRAVESAILVRLEVDQG
jgi:hypothetical protein